MVEAAKKLKERFEGEKIYFCDSISGSRINFEPHSVSLCHEATLRNRPKEVLCVSDISDFSVDKFYEHIYHLLELFQDEGFPCRKCPLCKLGEFHFAPISFAVVGLSHSCNSNCIYCDVRVGGENEGYEIAPLIKAFAQDNLISPEVLFNWGGGEPTSHVGFEDAVRVIADNGYRQRIHTNAILFSQAAHHALQAGNAILFVSVDSGTEPVFRRVKGHCGYSAVWKNVAEYVSCSLDNVFVKFNVMNYNSDEREIDAFLEQCLAAKVRNVVVSAEISSYCTASNAGPFYFTEKEFQAAHYLHSRARQMGFNVLVAKFAFQVRGEYDKDGNLKLPSSYFDNIDHEALCRNIRVEAFPTVESVLEHLSSEGVVIFCGEGWGTLAYRAFKKAGKDCICIDSGEKYIGTIIDDCVVGSAREFLATCDADKTYQIIVAGANVQEIVSQINHSDINARLFWAAGAAYRKYLGRKQISESMAD